MAEPQPPSRQARRALACLNCRAARAACEGEPPPEVVDTKTEPPVVAGAEETRYPAPQPCPRCARLRRPCVWVPSHRTGRPRKRPRSAAGNATATSSTASAGDPSLRGSSKAVADQHDAKQRKTKGRTPGAQNSASEAPPLTLGLDEDDPEVAMRFLDKLPLAGSPECPLDSMVTALPTAALREDIEAAATSAYLDLDAKTAPVPDGVDASVLDPDIWSQVEAFLKEEDVGNMGALMDSLASPPPANVTTALCHATDPVVAYDAPQPCAAPPPLPAPTARRCDAAADALRALSQRISAESAGPLTASRGSPPATMTTTTTLPSPAPYALSPLGLERRLGVAAFFERAAQFVPVLGRASRWLRGVERLAEVDFSLASQPPARLTVTAACAMGYRLCGPRARAAADEALSQARASMDALLARAPPPSDRSALLASLQGVRIYVELETALGAGEGAGRAMELACRLCRESGLHLLDAPPQAIRRRSGGAVDGGGNGGGGVPPLAAWAHTAEARVREGWEEHLDDLRRAWWETFLVDGMLHIASSGRSPRRLARVASQVAVELPVDPGEPLHSRADGGATADARREVYSVRVKACSLMAEAFLGAPSSYPGEAAARLAALDSLHADVLVRAHAGWREARAEERALGADLGVAASPSSSSWPRLGDEYDAAVAASTRAESLLFSMLVLHAGRVHLHRGASLPDVTLGMQSCSLGADAGSRPVRGGEVRAATAHGLGSSVEAILSSSTAILDLLRSDYLERMAEAPHAAASAWPAVPAASSAHAGKVGGPPGRHAAHASSTLSSSSSAAAATSRWAGDAEALLAEPTSSFARHGAFVGCALYVASFGVSLGVAARQSRPGIASVSADEATPCATTAAVGDVDGGGGRGAGGADGGAVWRDRTLLSHLCFAEATASHLARVGYPSAREYVSEIRVCRSAVEAAAAWGAPGAGTRAPRLGAPRASSLSSLSSWTPTLAAGGGATDAGGTTTMAAAAAAAAAPNALPVVELRSATAAEAARR